MPTYTLKKSQTSSQNVFFSLSASKMVILSSTHDTVSSESQILRKQHVITCIYSDPKAKPGRVCAHVLLR